MNFKPPAALTEEKHLKRVLGIIATIVVGGGLLLGGCFRHGKSSADTVKIDQVPLTAIQGDCDDDGCQLWWVWSEADGVWLLHAGTRAAAAQAIADGAVYVKTPEVG